MKKKTFFITGIGTDVGKTIVSAIICQALGADYFKPIQAGDVDCGDRQTVAALINNQNSTIHPCSYNLTSAMSPHAAAKIDGIDIQLDKIHIPKTSNHLLIEGAGGLLVPLNDKHTILDLIRAEYHVILVSRHYLGSINHTLMSLKILQERGHKVSVVFNGSENKATESIIARMSNAAIIGRINQVEKVNQDFIQHYAKKFMEKL